jgi:DNA-binding HxlR family transcriptional regulator
VRRSSYSPEPDCASAQSLGVIGDGWELLIVRDLARRLDRFDLLAESLKISRKVFTERLGGLIDSGIVEREPYQDRPPRFAYRLTARGRALLPVLVALQDWGDRWLLGDGELALTAALRLPTFRMAGTERLKRFLLVVEPDCVVRAVRYPVTDIPDAVDWAYCTAKDQP